MKLFFRIMFASVQILAGLLLHPYQTMQSLVKEKVFIWLTLSPLVVLAAVTIVWRGAVVPLVQILFTCSGQYYLRCDLVSLISNTLVFFCLYWQVLLLYLLVRFRIMLRNV